MKFLDNVLYSIAFIALMGILFGFITIIGNNIAFAAPTALQSFGGIITIPSVRCTVSNPLHTKVTAVGSTGLIALIEDISTSQLDTPKTYSLTPGTHILGNHGPVSLPCVSGTPLTPVPLGVGALIINFGLGTFK